MSKQHTNKEKAQYFMTKSYKAYYKVEELEGKAPSGLLKKLRSDAARFWSLYERFEALPPDEFSSQAPGALQGQLDKKFRKA